jgi:hypothetical protein
MYSNLTGKFQGMRELGRLGQAQSGGLCGNSWLRGILTYSLVAILLYDVPILSMSAVYALVYMNGTFFRRHFF